MPITRAIKKYGADAFTIECLCECSNQSELNDMEIYYATFLETFAPVGYNLCAGRGAGTMSDIGKRTASSRIGDIKNISFFDPNRRTNYNHEYEKILY